MGLLGRKSLLGMIINKPSVFLVYYHLAGRCKLIQWIQKFIYYWLTGQIQKINNCFNLIIFFIKHQLTTYTAYFCLRASDCKPALRNRNLKLIEPHPYAKAMKRNRRSLKTSRLVWFQAVLLPGLSC